MKILHEIVNKFDCQQGSIFKIIFNVDGEYCVTCGSDKTLKLWNPKTKLMLKTYSGHAYEVMDIDCSYDSGFLLSGSKDKTLIVWDVMSGQVVRRIRAHIGPVNSVCFNEDASVLISGSLDGTVKLWDNKSKTNEPIQTLDEAKDSVSYVTVTDHEIVSVSLDGHLRRYDIRKGQMDDDNLHVPLTYVSITNDNQCLLTSCLNSTIKLIDISTGNSLANFKGHKNNKYRVDNGSFLKDEFIVSGSEDGNVLFWDVLENKIITKIPHDNQSVNTLCISEKSSEMVVAAGSKIFLYKISTE